jgi:uncharacterized protein (DUF952 family)
MTDNKLFKIMTKDAWATFQNTGVFKGTPLDIADGYLHCSTIHQYLKVRKKFFANESDVMLLHLDVSKISAPIKWETSSRSGERYPHIYGELNLDAVIKVEKI